MKRFWEKVDKNGPIWEADGSRHWLWTGAVSSSGYGHLTIEGKTIKAHRFSMKLAGVRLGNKLGLHRCDTPLCVNPAHLYKGTKKDNAQDREQRGRANHATGDRHGARKNPGLHAGRKNGRSKITESDVREIRRRAPHETYVRLGESFGLTPTTISSIVQGKLWRHVEG